MNWLAASVLVLASTFAISGCQSSTSTRSATRAPSSEVRQSATKHEASTISPSPTPALPMNNQVPVKDDAQPTAKPAGLDELLLFFPTKHPDGDWQPVG